MTALAAQILAALDRAEETARAATPGPWEQHTSTWRGEHGLVHDWELSHPQEFGGHVVHPANVVKARGAEHAADSCCWPPTAYDAAHIAANDPAHVLRLTTALRKVVNEHWPVDPCAGTFGPDGAPCPTLAALASVWDEPGDNT